MENKKWYRITKDNKNKLKRRTRRNRIGVTESKKMKEWQNLK